MKVNNKRLIIDRLKNATNPISGEKLSLELGISRTAIWKNIKKLNSEGYNIEASPTGYRLQPEDDLLLPYEFHEDNQLYIYKERTYSTMDLALELIKNKKAVDGTTIIAETQESGRGKESKKYSSPKGGLYFTIIFFPDSPISEINLYPIAGVMAVKNAISKLQNNVAIKWPFETLVGSNKVSGIIHEYQVVGNRCSWLTLGIGVNMDESIKRRELLESIKSEIKIILNNKNTILENYKKALNIIDRNYNFVIEGRNIEGKVVNIDQLGTLTITSNGNTEYGYIGDSSIKDEI